MSPSQPPPLAARKNQKRRRPRPRPRPRRAVAPKRRLWRYLRIGGIGLGALLVATGVFLFVTTSDFASQRMEGETGTVSLDWPRATTAAQAADLLAGAGLVRSATRMALYLESAGGTDDFVPGPHLLPRGASPEELVELLRRGPGRPQAKLVIPEGFHRFAIGKRVEAAGICSAVELLEASEDPLLLAELEVPGPPGGSPESAEGFLFPATYELPHNTHARDVVRRLVRESDRRWAELTSSLTAEIAELGERLGWGRREVTILASIVEKEAAVEDERARIAGVFLNRLLDPSFQPKRLQSDPTSAYGCLARPADAPSCAGFEGRITPEMNRDRLNLYSTYAHDDLPPGPIANPGTPSLRAVLVPEKSSYFYFVAAGGGRHHFSESYDDHRRAIRGEADAP